jgi:hypothetical protein
VPGSESAIYYFIEGLITDVKCFIGQVLYQFRISGDFIKNCTTLICLDGFKKAFDDSKKVTLFENRSTRTKLEVRIEK